jgi:hypothetical protein
MLPFHVESQNGIEFRPDNSGPALCYIHKLGKKGRFNQRPAPNMDRERDSVGVMLASLKKGGRKNNNRGFKKRHIAFVVFRIKSLRWSGDKKLMIFR